MVLFPIESGKQNAKYLGAYFKIMKGKMEHVFVGILLQSD